MEKYIERYINDFCKLIIDDIVRDGAFYFRKEKYINFLTLKRIDEIKIYKSYHLHSPQLYNLCYLILTTEYGLDKKYAIRLLEEDVSENKKEMEKILKHRYSQRDYEEKIRKELEIDPLFPSWI